MFAENNVFSIGRQLREDIRIPSVSNKYAALGSVGSTDGLSNAEYQVSGSVHRIMRTGVREVGA
jgi:hypothetical protein